MVIGGISDALGESKISILDLAGNMQEMGKIVEQKLAGDFKEIGLSLTKFNFENFSLPEQLEKALDENSALSMYRKNLDVYKAKGQTDAMINASKNNGSLGGFMGAGIGMGMGSQIANQMTGSAGNFCPNCNTEVKHTAKFCPECGTKMKPVCPNCKKEFPANTKFCPDCGTKL
jgi:membrane protease subunit (stomatin/prohibitin family)